MMKNRLMFTFLLLFFFSFSIAQRQEAPKKPKLVVGLVVDQMRWDYLYRYQNNYQNDGFKRLLSGGFSCENTMIPYIPTYTAPGHTCVYTGSVPAIHGIVGNNWYEALTDYNMYCAEDTTVSTVGSASKQGQMSPKNMLTTTIGDELRLSTNFKSKVFGVALKDRGAILPAGHAANGAFWYDDTVGKWISSTYYGNALPDWVVKYNNENSADKYMNKDWNTLLPIEKYVNSTADLKPYEGTISGIDKPVFPYKTSTLKKKLSAFKTTPFAATYTFDMAKAIIDNEKLGSGDVTDMIAISISSTDYAGHTFGPNSIEVEDTYLRLDQDIAAFLTYLDKKVGEDNYLLFLTADHGGAHVPGFLNENNIPGGRHSSSAMNKRINQHLKETFNNDNLIVKVQNYQLYLNYDQIKKSGLNATAVEDEIINQLNKEADVQIAFRTAKVEETSIPAVIKDRVVNGYNPKRSGDIGYILIPGYMSVGSTGTTHGTWNPYDSHIPLVWYGTNIKAGKTARYTYMTDIAPTVAALLQIQQPNGTVGSVIQEIMKN